MGGTFDYRSTIGPWFRGILSFQPDASFMIVPLMVSTHDPTVTYFRRLKPFTRLVHVWSLPLEYLGRNTSFTGEISPAKSDLVSVSTL
ncbi:respiratory nitrate reductase subunit gamma [Anaerobacillus sp. HL2]|nr:respiratory nitrate reductase subunit gamma [Anaerobacillus sp. HL2]